MEHDPQTSNDPPVSTGLEGIQWPTSEVTSSGVDHPAPTPTQPAEEPGVNIPLQDVTKPVEEVNQVAASLTPEVRQRVQAALRAIDPAHPQETVHDYNERVKKEFTDQVLEARHRAAAPPPPPQPVAPFIMEQTKREMAAGAKQSAYWAQQQALNPRKQPSNKEVAAQGTTVPVFQPASYVHEKGEGYQGKEYTRTNLV